MKIKIFAVIFGMLFIIGLVGCGSEGKNSVDDKNSSQGNSSSESTAEDSDEWWKQSVEFGGPEDDNSWY